MIKVMISFDSSQGELKVFPRCPHAHCFIPAVPSVNYILKFPYFPVFAAFFNTYVEIS